MKQSKVPLWKNGFKAAFFVYFMSMFFIGNDISLMWFPDYKIGIALAVLLFIASSVLGATAAISKKKADALKSNPGPSDSEPSTT